MTPRKSPICCAPTSFRQAYVYPADKRPAARVAAPAHALRLEPQRTVVPHPVPSTGPQPAHLARPYNRESWGEQLLAPRQPLRQLALQNDLALIRHYDAQLATLAKKTQTTKQTASRDFTCSKPSPASAISWALTILHEIGDIARFPTVKDFLSYCRLVKGTVASAGKIKGLRGAKLGNPYLRWAFGEAAVIAKRDHCVIGPLAQRLEARLNGNKFKANTVLAIKLARAVYFMLKNKTVFDPERLVAALAKN